MAVRLEWEGKPEQVERLNLPFQTVETINESRATRERDAGSLLRAEPSPRDARNQLIWGDNKLVMSSLLQDFAGQVKLIYIDPPFDTGTDFSFRVLVGDATVTKLPSILEEHAYRDTWGQGRSSYLTMLYDRLVLIHELLAHDGLLFLHVGAGVAHVVRSILDEIFGPDRFRNEIVWKRTFAHSDAKTLGAVHEGSLAVHGATRSELPQRARGRVIQGGFCAPAVRKRLGGRRERPYAESPDDRARHVHPFKQFEDRTLELHPSVSLLGGGKVPP